MKTFLILLIIFFLSFLNMFAQAPDTLWTKTFGSVGYDLGMSVKQTYDSGYIIAGYSNSYGSGDIDAFLIKTDSMGDTIWTNVIGGTGLDICMSTEQTSDSGYIFAGYSKSYGAQGFDGWLFKLDINGDTLWTRLYGGNSYEHFYEVHKTFDEGFILIGETGSYGAGQNDLWIIKTDANGDTIWTKTYGDSYSDIGYSVQQTHDSCYIVLGSTFSPTTFKEYLWLIKTDSNGDSIWTKKYEFSLSGRFTVQNTHDFGYIIGCTYSDNIGQTDILLIKTNENGDSSWCKKYGGNSDEYIGSVIQTKDNNYIIAGFTDSYGSGEEDMWLIKTDSNGETIYTTTIGSDCTDVATDIQQTLDNGYIIVGVTKSFGEGLNDVWLIKTEPDINNNLKKINKNIPFNYYLNQNYPNPFNPSTKIKYTLPKSEQVKIKVFNLLGQKIETLLNKQMPTGSHEIEFTAKNLPSGVYLYRIVVDSYGEAGDPSTGSGQGFQEVRKMILLK